MTEKIILLSGGEYGDIYVDALASAIRVLRPAAALKSIKRGDGNDAKGEIEREFERGKAACVVWADQGVPDFRLMDRAKSKGARVIDYAGAHTSPLRKKHLGKLKGCVDKVLAAFAYDGPMYDGAGIDVEFVGHPLVDLVDCSLSRNDAKAALGYDWTEQVVTLIPGLGTPEETADHMRLIVEGAAEAAAWSSRKVRLVIPDAERFDEDFLNDLIKAAPRKPKAVKGRRQIALRGSSAAVIGDGTAAIEAALSATHFLIIHKTLGLSHFLSGILKKDELYGLPNVVIGRRFFPELVQKDATPKNITIELGGLLETDVGEEMDQALSDVKKALGAPGSIKRAAEAVLRVAG